MRENGHDGLFGVDEIHLVDADCFVEPQVRASGRIPDCARHNGRNPLVFCPSVLIGVACSARQTCGQAEQDRADLHELDLVEAIQNVLRPKMDLGRQLAQGIGAALDPVGVVPRHHEDNRLRVLGDALRASVQAARVAFEAIQSGKVGIAGNTGMVLARNLKGIAILGFDALPETLGKIRDGEITATIEQFPGKQSSLGVQTLAAFIKSGKRPAEKILLLTPVAITKDNLKVAERLGEVK